MTSNEAAWAELYSTKSRPFDRPGAGKIAVKVINHYGDDVLKVFGVGKGIMSLGALLNFSQAGVVLLWPAAPG